MKLLNILGAVIAVHIAVLVLAIVIPGCRSTQSTTVPPTTTNEVNTPAPMATSRISAAPEMRDADLNPPLAGDVATNFDPNATATAAPSGTRFSPTRPLSPSSGPTDVMIAPPPAPAQPVATYTVTRGDNLWTLAKKNNLSVRELASANGLSADAGLRVGQVLVIPGQAPAASPAINPAAAGDRPTENSRSYVIRPGDTLGKIARVHGTSVAELKAFNRLTSDMVRAGDRLYIPETATVAPPTGATTAAATSPTAAPVADNAAAFKHTVAPGESLAVIASRYGVRVGEIALANQVRDPSLIRPGQELIIPGWEAPPPAPAEPAAAATIPTLTAASADEVEEDLDAGLADEDLSDVPVITLDEPVKTIGGGDQSPPVFE
jgi:LysM repeat protein